MLSKIKSWIKNLPNKKPYIELIVTVLTVPVLVTLIIVNYSNIQNKNKSSNSDNRPIIIERNSDSGKKNTEAVENEPSPSPSPNPEACKDRVGPVSIVSPKEGAVVSENPVNFIIRYEDESFCSVVWSYRINNSNWSEYSSNSPTVYNLPQGPVKFELRVQSTVSEDQDLLERNFIYGGVQVSPSPSPSVEN